MTERKDDGSIMMVVWTTLAAIGFFFMGYWFRDSGRVIRILEKPTPIAAERQYP